MRFAKYHALGNDYLVIDPADVPGGAVLPPGQIRLICHRNLGVGSDGILWGPLPSNRAAAGLRIFNPDASEAGKSGNGLRIFSRYLWDRKLVASPDFKVETPAGVVDVHIGGDGLITVDMGAVSFASQRIPVAGPPRDVINEQLTVQDRTFTFCAAEIGNPHCVIPLPEISAALATRYGADIERHPIFPQRTNVQFLQVLDRANIRIEIWERGAGHTMASGSSSSASAAVARRLGLVDEHVTVHMPGGRLSIDIGPGYAIRMTGPVTRVAEGTIDPGLLSAKA